MNKKAKKAYEKAMNYYEKGKINKALEICEKVLLEGLDNPSVLNFKGLLLYQKGNLNEALTIWKINKELNNDDIAKTYIKDAMADENRVELYIQGEQALKQLKIDKALELFKKCSESDFNSIKVNTGIAMCYQKKGDIYKSKEYVDKALSIDQNAITAKIIDKELKEDGMYLESQRSSKGFLIGITILFVVVLIAIAVWLIILKSNHMNFINNIEETQNNNVVEEKSSSTMDASKIVETQNNIEVNPEITSKEELQNTYFDREKLKTLVDRNDLDGIYEQLKNVKQESISSEDAELYTQAINLMKGQGVSKFYEYGLWYFNQNNYSDAKISLDKAYTYCDGNSLKEHIIFYRASTMYKQQDNWNSLAQYEEYYNQYPEGTYVQEVLYQLALLSNSSNKEKSKMYANTLINNFPGSIYINDNIVNIIKS